MTNSRRRGFGLVGFLLAATSIALLAACDPPRGSDQSVSADSSVDVESPADAQPAKTKLPVSGDVVLIGGWSKGNKSTATAEFYDPATGKFNKTGSLAVAAGAGVAALITAGADGPQILAAGGFGGSSKFTKRTVSNQITGMATNDLQIYHPLGGLFGAPSTPSLLSMPRVGATATTLGPALILIAGGADPTGNPTSTAEVFDVGSGLSTLTVNNMSSPRVFHTATMLDNGTVLIAGGGTDSVGDLTATADIYDPGTNSFTPTIGALIVPRAAHAAVLLTTGSLAGQVLIVSGISGSSSGLFADNEVEAYNPSSGIFSSAGFTNDARAFHSATTLSSGMVLIVGGFTSFLSTVNGATGGLMSLFGSSLSSAELFDPSALTFTCVPGSGFGGGACSAAMKMARGAHTATLFATGPLAGQVLIAGGLGAKKPNSRSKELKEAELYDPASNAFTKTGKLKEARGLHSAVLLP